MTLSGGVGIVLANWRLAILILATLGSLHPRTAARCSGLVLPCLLLVLHQSLLFVPVPGAVSTSENVIFWSVGAYAHVWLVLPLAWVLFKRVLRPIFRAADGCLGCLGVLLAVLVPATTSGLLLPIDGWHHIYMPLVVVLALPKILIVQPVFVPVCLGGLGLQLWSGAFHANRGARELNKLLLAVLACVGLIHLPFAFSSELRDVVSFRQRANLGSERAECATQSQISWDCWHAGHLNGYLDKWADELDEVARCAVTGVDTGENPCTLQEIVHELRTTTWAPLSTSGAAMPIAGLATFLLLPSVVALARRRQDRHMHRRSRSGRP